MSIDESHPPTRDAASAVVLRGVDQSFGDNPALVQLDLTVPRGSITVLLGPNGAGKTTATRVITGAIEAQAGEVRVFGLDPRVDGEAVRRRCGVVSAKPALYDRLSGRANLGYAAELYGLGRSVEVDDRISAAAHRFGIESALDNQVGSYSTGMKTRLALARSVLHEPDLLLFDEPTSGLDPESSHAVLEMIHDMTHGGVTVIMCTHLLLEAEGLAEQVVVLESGSALAAGPPAELISSFWPDAVVRLDAANPERLGDLERFAGVAGVEIVGTGMEQLAGFDGGTASSGDEVARLPRTGVDVSLSDPKVLPDLVAALIADGIRLTRVEPRIPSLEDLYFAIRRRHVGALERSEDGGRRLQPRGATVGTKVPPPPPPPGGQTVGAAPGVAGSGESTIV
ncbi:MAG TPA: ABC transporter ATP-binding protein [Acidimicrobiales bacterium]|nr:ABC transporter ATP-binding protein [Acidimicrobiales bacterium]